MTEKKLIPFNLERALAGDPVIANDGHPVTQLKLFENLLPENYIDDDKCLVGVYRKNVRTFTLDGKNFVNNIYLFMAPKIKTYYIDIHKDAEENLRQTAIYEYKNMHPKDEYSYIKTISFEIEEE